MEEFNERVDKLNCVGDSIIQLFSFLYKCTENLIPDDDIANICYDALRELTSPVSYTHLTLPTKA